MLNAPDASSIRPYLLRALHEWCTDRGYTPYVVIAVDDTVQVPFDYVQNGEIVLNVSYDATSSLVIGDEFIEFKARFGGVPREIIVPIGNVVAIYARENGQGMSFPMAAPQVRNEGAPASVRARTRPQLKPVENLSTDNPTDDRPPPPSTPTGRPTLTRVK